jgi:outer membrane murein-binding lipoprotein Lpp
MKNRKTILTTVSALAVAGTLFSGCSQQEVQLASSLANSAAGSVGTHNAPVNQLQTLSSPAGAGMLQSQVIGAQMLTNPAVLGVGAVSTAISEHNKAQNQKAFGNISSMYVNSDQINSRMEGMMVQAYNKKYGTQYRTMAQLQEAVMIEGYNEKCGTKYTTLSQVRVDYNKRKGTHFETDNEFRVWLEKQKG